MKLPQAPPKVDLADVRADRVFAHWSALDAKGRYLHWDEMRRRRPPADLTHEEWWFATALARAGVSRPLPFEDTAGRRFAFCNVDPVQEMVHTIDQQAGGHIASPGTVMNIGTSDRYLVRSLVEEAITSSQLEGASTTRRVAKEMLESGREPVDRDERMISNNFRAMVLAQDMAESGDDLVPEAVLELHRVVTDGTLENPTAAGRLQDSDGERIAVWWNDSLLHRPPPVAELPQRLDRLCDFANGAPSEGFMHPVVRSILLHFMLAYDHPFEDGNGRTARALFYWSMLRHGYWLSQYLSISTILRKAPSQYVTSFLKTETDGGDVTYFVLYQLGVVCRSIDALHGYLEKKMAEVREVEALMRHSGSLNHRQVSAVGEALRDPYQRFTFNGHASRHGVTYQSARTDLLGLERLGLLHKTKRGREFVFHPVEDLATRLKGL